MAKRCCTAAQKNAIFLNLDTTLMTCEQNWKVPDLINHSCDSSGALNHLDLLLRNSHGLSKSEFSLKISWRITLIWKAMALIMSKNSLCCTL
jgi:hypothetical protein